MLGSGIARNLAAGPRMSAGRVRDSLACAADATPRHMVHRAPQDRDHRLDRRPDRDRDARRLGRLRLQRRIQPAQLRLARKPSTCSKTTSRRSRATRRQIVYKADAGVETPAVKQQMEGVFDEVEELPHVSEVASPYESGGAARDQRRRRDRLRDRPVRRHHRQARTTSEAKKLIDDRRGGERRRPPGRGRRPADRGSPRRRRRRPLLR